VSYALIAVAVAIIALRFWTRRRRRPGSEGTDSVVARAVRRVSAAVDTLGGDVALVARREIRERTKTRAFRVATVVILLAVAAAVIVPTLRKGHHDQERVAVVGALSAPLRVAVVAAGPAVGTKVVLVPEPSLAAARRDLRAGRVAVALVDARRIVVGEGFGPSDTSTTALLSRVLASEISLQAGLEQAGIPPGRAAALAHPPPLPVSSLQPAPRNDTARTTEIYSLVLTYVLLTQFGTWILMGVVEEKSSRVVEVLLSTLRPAQLLQGKVIGIGVVALAQAALIVGVALGLGAAVGSDLLHGTAPSGVLGSLVWVVLGYAFYSWVYAAGGSLADRQEQVQSLAFPLQLPILFGYIVSFTALGSGSPSTLIKVLAYLPPTAPFAMPVLLGLGHATWWEFTLSAALMVAAIAVTARLAGAVYARAILRTGGRLHVRQLFAAEGA
jgi:ABC-2 type transport system permease protein